MMKRIDLILGNTPLVKVEGIYAKLEAYNPTGSIKDRMVEYIIEKAEERGQLKPGIRIIECTSGNTGIALARIAAIKGYKFTAVMPEHMSIARRKMMKAFGADIVLTRKEDDMKGAFDRFLEMKEDNPDAFFPMQFENEDNINAHMKNTGREIVDALGKVDIFVAGIGTGGTLIGVGKALLHDNPDALIVGVEPAESAVLNSRNQGLHGIQGIGEGFIPALVRKHRDIIDEVVMIHTDDAKREAESLARRHGLLVGISSGANFMAAKILQERYGNDKVIVTVFADRGERYLD